MRGKVDTKRRSWLRSTLLLPLLWMVAGCQRSLASAPPAAEGANQVRVSNYPDLASAVAALPSGGGTVYIDQTIQLHSTVDVPPGVEIAGCCALPGNNGTSNHDTNHLQQTHIMVAQGVSPAFRLHGASGVKGVFLHKAGVDFGDNSAAMFADDAIHIRGEDAYVDGCFITGFNQAVHALKAQRPRISNNRIDCLNGIWVETAYDIARIRDNHCWPFVTAAVDTPASAWREGTAFGFAEVCDWGQLQGNFCFGYRYGFVFHNVAQMTVTQCGADSFPVDRRGIGFLITGACENITLIACQAASQSIGFQNNMPPVDRPNRMIGCSHWANDTHVSGW